ncbi:MAG: RNA methyltransferase [Thermoleophilia bacterium]|nr:RNA methyltransferase [Thermoleophilia bacterium]
MQPKQISSTSNAIIKEAARLKRKRSRHESRLFLVEGEDLLDAALARGILPRQVFVLEGHGKLLPHVLRAADGSGGRGAAALEVCFCSEPVMAKLSELGSGTRVIATFSFLDRKLAALGGGEAQGGVEGEAEGEAEPGRDGMGPLLYLSGTSDPGNVGTLVRSAASLGASGVAIGPGTADCYSPKALRATMGAIFQIPIYLGIEPVDLISRARAAGMDILRADPHAGVALWDGDLAGNFILALGSEREGIPPELMAAASTTVRIPQLAATESMNVAMAGTTILYEALRQRMAGISH